MDKTLDLLKAYLEIFNVDRNNIKEFLTQEKIQLYSIIRDKLTYAERVELEIILNNIYNNYESKNKIDLSKYIHLNKKLIDKTEKIMLDRCISKKDCIFALCTIINMEPKEVVSNYLTNN